MEIDHDYPREKQNKITEPTDIRTTDFRWFPIEEVKVDKTIDVFDDSADANKGLAVNAYRDSIVNAYQGSIVNAYRGSTVNAHRDSTANIYGGSTVNAYRGSTFNVYERNSTIYQLS